MDEETAVSNDIDGSDVGSDQMQDAGATEDGNVDSEGQVNKCYPSDELLKLFAQVTQLRAAPSIWTLLPCLETTHSILQQGHRARQADMESVRRFFREDLLFSFDKVLQYPGRMNLSQHDVRETLMETFQTLVVVAAYTLHHRSSQVQPGDVTAELDNDLLPVAQCLLNLFNEHRPLMLQLALCELPEFTNQQFQRVDDSSDEEWASPILSSEQHDLDEDEQQEPVSERHRWLVHLINFLGKLHGFNSIIHLLQQPVNLGFAFMNMLTAVLAQVVEHATDEKKLMFYQVVAPLVLHLTDLVETDSDKLNDFGSDKTYSIFGALVNINLPRIIVQGPSRHETEMQLQHVHCMFVEKMLESSSFNKLLTAVRECNRMLGDAAQANANDDNTELLPALIKWMDDKDIVQRILRTNLHQRQYMQQVQGIMVTLTVNQFLTSEHLDMLWAITEKEDTYEAVKTHMFDLLAEIASKFGPSQLDMLFAKLERAQERSTQDTQRLLGLLQHLAQNDSEVKMVDKITSMVWELTIPATTHPDVDGPNALQNVLRAYKKHKQKPQNSQFVFHWLLKCFNALVNGTGGQVPLLRSLRKILELLPDQEQLDKQNLNKEAAVDALNKGHGFTTKLVDILCSKVAAAHEALAAAAAEAAAVSNPAAASAVRQAALELLGEGGWSYTEVVKEYIMTVRHYAVNSPLYFDENLAVKLWDALMVNPPNKEDMLPPTQSFFRTGFQGAGTAVTFFFEHSTQLLLLEKHMVLQDPCKVSASAARLFVDIFQQVNLDKDVKSISEALTKQGRYTRADRLENVKGLDFLWQVYVRNPDDKVASFVEKHLLHLYHCYSYKIACAPFKQAMIRRVVSLMHEVAPSTTGPGQDADMGARIVTRCLRLVKEAISSIDMATMPPVPHHCYSWRGTPLVLDVQRDGASRLRLSSHSNEYVGLLRERLAKHIGCNSRNVRMLYLGKEWNVDAAPMSSVWDSKGRSVVTAVVSPEGNHFTLAPEEFKDTYQSVGMGWMLSQAEGVYSLLLRFIDMHSTAAGSELPEIALELLTQLPTYPVLSQRLAAALDGADKQQQLATALDPNSNRMDEDWVTDADGAAPAGVAAADGPTPYQTLYALQALCSLLFPSFDESLFDGGQSHAEAVAEASACPSPAANGTDQAPAAAPVATAAMTALQKQHQCELQQQEFLQSRGLEIVIEAAHKAASSSSNNLKLRRELSELLVIFLHNLVDAANNWSHPPGDAGSLEMMSGAESGAGAAAATAVAADSGVAAMAGVQQGEDGGSSAVGGNNTNNNVQQLSSPAGVGAAMEPLQQQQQQQSDSPHMEDVASSLLPSSNQQQQVRQQQLKQQQKQRQRGGDLPPLPPAAAAQGSGSNAAALIAATAAEQNFTALFGAHALKLMAETLMNVAAETSQLYGASSIEPLSVECTEKDVIIVKDALQLLLHLLEQQPALVQSLLLEVEQSPLVTVVLVNPHYQPLRRQAAELLERLISSEVHPRLLPWLLQQLAASRPVAQSLPSSCQEFYKLLAAMVLRMGKAWGSLPQQLFNVANHMLDDEVAALREVAASATVGAAAAASASTTTTSSQQAAETACTLLQGRLQLILALVRVLDRRAIGSDSHGGLIRLLLEDFLFPEAVQYLAVVGGQLDLSACAARMEPRCTTPSCRKAALELLAELMGDAPSSLVEGVGMLIDLHYQTQPLNNWNVLPKMLRQPGEYMGLKNGGATCYMNAVFQQLFMQPEVREGVLAAQAVAPQEARDSVFAQLQKMFAMMALGKGTFHIPRDFWNAFKDYDGSPIDTKEHQDAYEFFTRLQDFVDQHLISTGQKPAIKPVMGGRFVQQIICRGHNYTSEREEDFYQISVDVKGMGSLEKSLDDYVKGELMEGDNAYMCEELGKRVPAVKRSAIKALPQMLCIHLKRFEFDYHNQTRYKVRDRFEFPLEIDMFAYTADGLAAADQQQKAAEQQQEGNSSTARTSSNSSGGGGLRRQLSDAVHQALAAKPAVGGYVYDLMGVVVHSGSAFTGHYYSYIKERRASMSASSSSNSDTDAADQWYCFDDKSVTPWDITNLEVECYGGKPSQDSDGRIRPSRNEYERAHSAYMLFYERRQTPAAAAAAADTRLSSTDTQQEAAAGCKTGSSTQQVAQGPTAVESCDTAAAAAVSEQDVPMAAAAAGSLDSDSAVASADLGVVVAPGFRPPYNMPLSLYKHVTEHNIHLMWQQHVLDKDYFRFIRQLVDSKGDLGQLSNRKARRRDAVAPAAGVVVATASGSSGGRIHSSMSCDPPAAGQQQQQPQVAMDPGDAATTPASPCPMAISPAPVASITAAAALPSKGAPDGTTAPASSPAQPAVAPSAAAGSNGHGRFVPAPLTPPTEPQASPGPSSRRGEEADAVAQALLRLGVLFQFQVYLKAHENLRSESSVWTEALMGMMNLGPSSTSCLQVFLELQLAHPENWMHQYLVDYEGEVPTAPKKWAVDMMGWALETAAKRCSRVMAEYVKQWLNLQTLMVSAAASSSVPQFFEDAHASIRQQQPPLVQAVLSYVENICNMVRLCVPTKRASSGGSSAAAAAMLAPDMPDIPVDAVRVLHRYALLGPWAAAHLMQVHDIVPALAEICGLAIAATEPEEDAVLEDLVPLYELIAELLSHADNLPHVAAEFDGRQAIPELPNPFIRSSSSTAAGLAGGSSCDEQQQGGTSSSSAAAPAQFSGTVMLPPHAYRLLVTDSFLKGLTSIYCVKSYGVVRLAGILTWNSVQASLRVMQAAMTQLYKVVHPQPVGEYTSNWFMDTLRRHLTMIVLLPDGLLDDRVFFFLVGRFSPQRSSSGRMSDSVAELTWAFPGLAHWGVDKPLVYPCANFFHFMDDILSDYKQGGELQSPVDYKRAIALLFQRIWDIRLIQSGGSQLYSHMRGEAHVQELCGQVEAVLQEAHNAKELARLQQEQVQAAALARAQSL